MPLTIAIGPGPAPFATGSEEIKQRYPRSFTARDVIMCQLFSEPNAAPTRKPTRAVRDGDEW
ncbi:MAG: hypothetical protein U0W40_06525 [Acidimicrobiia bacterium]